LSLYKELKRRNVIRACAAYLVFAWLAVQVADILLDAFDVPGWVLRSLVIVLAVGFPVTVVLSWVYEITSRGVVRGADLKDDLQRAFGGRQIDFVIIGVLLIAVVLFAADKFRWIEFEDKPMADHDSIAVLPFTLLSPNPDNDYYAEAMTDELISRLGRLNAVRVKSRLSVARFKHTKRDVSEIAAELGVDYVLEGTVRKDNDRVRVTTQLTDAGSGFQKWSDVFDGESEDWFSLQEDMAIKIANALDLNFSPREAEALRSHYTNNPEAYDEFWRGWLLLESFHSDASHPEEKFRAAEHHLQQALELDPYYPLALAGLSLANSYAYFYGIDRTVERQSRSSELASRAIALDPDFPEGRVAVGMAYAAVDDHNSAASEFREALEKDAANGMIWCLLAYSCIAQAPPDLSGAEEAARNAIRNDPTWTYSYQMLGWTLFLQGRYEESAKAYQTGVAFNPNYFEVHFGLGKAQLEMGDFIQARSAFEAARALGETRELLIYLAASHAGLGDSDQALDLLEMGLNSGFSDLDAIEGSPYFLTLGDDPRFKALVESHRRH
jgi:TolB-like protein/Tfp pilus assembly protein PilF